MPTCPFCGYDPYDYIDIGVGMQAVAVTCCELGIELFDHRRTGDVTLTREEFADLAQKMSDMHHRLGNGDFVIPAEDRDDVIDECLDQQPSTAENPNEDAYQRGRFDGIMEFAQAIQSIKSDQGDPRTPEFGVGTHP